MKREALAKHLDVAPDEISEESDDTFTYGLEEYRVLTDDEADQAWEESLDSYIEDCIMPEIKDENLRRYFDCDAWKRDARHDGRGHCLSGYDGEEHEIKMPDGIYYYIYRTN